MNICPNTNQACQFLNVVRCTKLWCKIEAEISDWNQNNSENRWEENQRKKKQHAKTMSSASLGKFSVFRFCILQPNANLHFPFSKFFLQYCLFISDSGCTSADGLICVVALPGGPGRLISDRSDLDRKHQRWQLWRTIATIAKLSCFTLTFPSSGSGHSTQIFGPQTQGFL